MVSDLVTHDLHDVVAVGDETKRQGSRKNGKLPHGHGSLRLGSVSGVPSRVDDSPRTNSVTDIVGAVSERSSAGSENLNKRVRVLNLVRILLSVAVDALHTPALRSSVNTSLSSVDVVVDTVKAANNEHGGNALESNEHVLPLIDLAGLDLVLVEVAHGPAQRTALVAELGVEAFLALSDELLVAELAVFGDDGTLLGIMAVNAVVGVGQGLRLHLIVMLDDGVIGDKSSLSTRCGGAAEEERTQEDVVPADRVIALDNLGVEVGDKEEEGEDGKTNTARDGDSSDIPRRLLVETEVGRSLVDDRERANSAGNQKEERSSPDSPWDGVLAEMDCELDQHEDDGTEAGGGSGSHSQASEDSTETLAVVPSPLNFGGASDSNTDTSDRRDERVGRRDVSGVFCAPHDPGGGTGESAGEGQHLNTSVALEGVGGDNSILDGIGSTGTNGDGTYHLEDGTENHGLAV